MTIEFFFQLRRLGLEMFEVIAYEDPGVPRVDRSIPWFSAHIPELAALRKGRVQGSVAEIRLKCISNCVNTMTLTTSNVQSRECVIQRNSMIRTTASGTMTSRREKAMVTMNFLHLGIWRGHTSHIGRHSSINSIPSPNAAMAIQDGT